MISQIETDVAEVKDHLLQAKVFQTHYANLHRSPEIPFKIGDKVMLSTLHRCQQFKKKGEKWVAKFFPHYDGPYDIIDVHIETLNYTLELPNSPNTYLTYRGHDTEPRILMESIRSPGKLLILYQESSWSPSGVHQESSWSPSGPLSR